MKLLKKSLLAGFIATTLLSGAMPAVAGTVLRLDEVAVGELDPAKASDYGDSILMFNVYDTLVMPRQGGPGQVPHLAESWANEGNVFTFNLRKDITFQSGNAFTAADVVFSYERMNAIGAGLSYLFKNVESVEAVDENTVKFTLKTAYAPFISSLVRLPIIDKKLVTENIVKGDGEMGDWGQAYLSSNAAGSGAYTVSAHNPQEVTVMQKNADYFLPIAAAAPDEVQLRYGLEAATVRALISKGEHDISSQWLPPEVVKSLADDGAQLLTESGSGGFYIKMNTTKAPFDDVNCRKAVAEAFDYSTAIKMVAINAEVSKGSPATGAIPVGMFGAKTADNMLSQDLDAAKKYLASCKYDLADIDIELSWIAEVPLEERFALLLQSNLNVLGMKSTIKKVPWALFTELVSKPENTPHISQLYVKAVTGDPDTLLYGMYHSSSVGTWQSPENLNDSEVDKLLEAGRTAADDAGREAAYAALNDRLLEIMPTVYGYDNQNVFAASNRVKVPAFTDPEKRFGLSGMGFSFRLMEMTE